MTTLTPSVAASRRTLDADRQLPSVRAMGTPKRAPGVAMRKSHALASAMPPPTAQPSTTAMVGMGNASRALTYFSTFSS
ncbi:hypothetical protein BN961_02498 [Afipia felis]|uniref:Uncharacterized protein n=1 Tax=Afipia felis TaxID=1035 RepID=A0A090MS84_AFIFE|nr:hypothetical protein BN961_02498 [Afipia felis]